MSTRAKSPLLPWGASRFCLRPSRRNGDDPFISVRMRSFEFILARTRAP